MFVTAERDPAGWRLRNRLGHELRLECGRPPSVRIGVLGTRTDVPLRQKMAALASRLAALPGPVMLLDTRRTGVGGQGSWSPLEFATLIPERMGGGYEFLHVPSVAPSPALLADRRIGWREFRRRYREEVPEGAVRVARAFAEWASTAGGLAVLLCAEADLPSFDDSPQEEQEAHYCHRFTLSRMVADSVRAEYGSMPVSRVHLSLAAEPYEVPP